MQRRLLLLSFVTVSLATAAVLIYVSDHLDLFAAREARLPTPPSDLVEACNSDNPSRKLSGCSALINQPLMLAADRALALSRRSDVYIAAGDLDRALADRAKAAQFQPNDGGYRSRLAQVHYLRAVALEKSSNIDGALANYAQALRIDPANHPARLGRVNLHVIANKIDEAIEDLKAGAQREPASDTFRVWLSKLYEHRANGRLLKGDLVEAIADYTSALGQDRANALLYVGRGSAYAAGSDLTRAVKDYTEAIRLEPRLVEAYIRRGELYYLKEEVLLSLSDLNEALELDGDNLEALLLRALVREANDQRDYAARDYRIILRLEPSHRLAKRSLQRVSQPMDDAEVIEPPQLPAPSTTPRDRFCLNCPQDEGATFRLEPPVYRPDTDKPKWER